MCFNNVLNFVVIDFGLKRIIDGFSFQFLLTSTKYQLNNKINTNFELN